MHSQPTEHGYYVQLLSYVVVYFFEGGEKLLIFVAPFVELVTVAAAEEYFKRQHPRHYHLALMLVP